MTSESTSSAASVRFADPGIHRSPRREDDAASVLARSPRVPEQPARKGDDAGYAVDRGRSARGRNLNIRV